MNRCIGMSPFKLAMFSLILLYDFDWSSLINSLENRNLLENSSIFFWILPVNYKFSLKKGEKSPWFSMNSLNFSLSKWLVTLNNVFMREWRRSKQEHAEQYLFHDIGVNIFVSSLDWKIFD